MKKFLSLILAVALLTSPAACGPRPVPVDGGAVTPASWTDTAHVVLDTLRWAVPAVRAVTNAILPEPSRTVVGRALDGVTDAAGRLSLAVQAYEARGGDRCAAYAAVGGVHVAIVQLAQVLADNGIAAGVVIERVADGLASIGDALVPACQSDAGWASAGDASNAQLRAVARSAAARGVTLRRDLDGIRPTDGGGR
jgi:hypothetical protein